jgi:hypothetical protein
MDKPPVNTAILDRLDELILEGEQQWLEYERDPGVIKDPMRFTKWTTSCLNLLDKLSVTTNRFVTEFEEWAKRGPGKKDVNLGASIGVIKAAREEYVRGFAIEYHLSVSAAIFGDLLSQAEYLLDKNYLQAAAVIAGAALEEGLKSRARSTGIEIGPKDTLFPVIYKLKDTSVLNDFESKKLEGVGHIRNEAAHGGEFSYKSEDVRSMVNQVRETLSRILSRQ